MASPTDTTPWDVEHWGKFDWRGKEGTVVAHRAIERDGQVVDWAYAVQFDGGQIAVLFEADMEFIN